MRCAGIANWSGRVSRFVALVAVVSLMLGSVARATDVKGLTDKLPRAYIGEFLWDGDKTVQSVVFTFDKVHALNEENAEVSGCGAYQVGRHVTTIKIRMFVKLPDLQVEIFEQAPEGGGAFETGGSHRGTLSNDLQRIDAQWTTTASGQRGQLHLRAASSAVCEPADSV